MYVNNNYINMTTKTMGMFREYNSAQDNHRLRTINVKKKYLTIYIIRH